MAGKEEGRRRRRTRRKPQRRMLIAQPVFFSRSFDGWGPQLNYTHAEHTQRCDGQNMSATRSIMRALKTIVVVASLVFDHLGLYSYAPWIRALLLLRGWFAIVVCEIDSVANLLRRQQPGIDENGEAA